MSNSPNPNQSRLSDAPAYGSAFAGSSFLGRSSPAVCATIGRLCDCTNGNRNELAMSGAPSATKRPMRVLSPSRTAKCPVSILKPTSATAIEPRTVTKSPKGANSTHPTAAFRGDGPVGSKRLACVILARLFHPARAYKSIPIKKLNWVPRH